MNDKRSTLNTNEGLISRQALLKLMGEEPFNWTDSDKELQEVEDYRNFRNMVEQLPPVKPQEPKWIPVSERLPEDVEDVLFCDLFGNIMLGYHPTDWKSTHFAERGSWELQKNVAAWMPLPSPYSTDDMASDKLTTDDGEPDGTGGQIFCP